MAARDLNRLLDLLLERRIMMMMMVMMLGLVRTVIDLNRVMNNSPLLDLVRHPM
jgi:hypothetical protein